MRIRLLGSVYLSNRSRCGSGRPKKYGSGTLVKSQKEVAKQKKSRFLSIFLLDDGRIRSPI
jgi:hypothetical protein